MITTAHIRCASKTARYGNVKKAKMAAIAFTKRGEIIATAYNRKISGHNTLFSIHAEASLLQKLEKIGAFNRFNNIVILVLRICKNGQISMSKPCDRCQKLLDENNVKVMYTHWSGNIMEM